jgi:hypothetical protein
MNFWTALTALFALELYVLRRLRFDVFVAATVIASTLLCANYLSYTSVDERNYDGVSQLYYIQELAQHLRLPNIHDCGTCGHPPLYYAVAALWTKGTSRWLPLEQGLQWLSLLMFFGFGVFALLIFRSRTKGRWPLRLAAALLFFWPSSILNSVRVHNDALSSLLMIAAMYYLARWDEHDRNRDFYAALTAAALALLTKASGYTVAATMLLLALIKLRAPEFRRERVKQCATITLVLVTAAVLAVSFRQSRMHRSDCQIVFGLACDGRYVPAVVDTPQRYISFDPIDFVNRMGQFPDDPKRDYFLNRFVKSSLFGVSPLGDEFGTEPQRTVARLLSVLLLAMIGLVALALPFQRDVPWHKYRVYLFTCAIMFGFLVAFRLRAPNEFHEDVRHIFPVLAPLCLGYASLVARLHRTYWGLGVMSASIGLAFVVCSAVFFVRLSAP